MCVWEGAIFFLLLSFFKIVFYLFFNFVFFLVVSIKKKVIPFLYFSLNYIYLIFFQSKFRYTSIELRASKIKEIGLGRGIAQW